MSRHSDSEFSDNAKAVIMLAALIYWACCAVSCTRNMIRVMDVVVGT